MQLRLPQLGDEKEALRLDELERLDGMEMLSGGRTYPEMVHLWEREARGETEPGRVPCDYLFALVNDEIVGVLSVRHELNEFLLERGGHIGYWVAPIHRRKGYASQMLRCGLDRLKALGLDRALVTCNDSNIASAATIERAGGILEDIRQLPGHEPTRRYWIAL